MEYIQIGKIATTHGIGGSLLITHALHKKVNFKGVKALFIEEVKDARIPWFIESATARTQEESIVKLEGLTSKESAHRLIRRNIWLKKEDFEKIAGNDSPISLLGYTLYDNKKLLGEVEEIIEQPNQLLIRLTIEEKEVLIPLHEEILKNIDHRKKAIYAELPDGLLDIYLT